MSTRQYRIVHRSVSALAVAAALVVAGCGGSEDASSPSTTVVVTTTAGVPAGPAAPTTTRSPADEALCSAAGRIAAGDAQIEQQLEDAVLGSLQAGAIDPLASLLAELRRGGILDGIEEAYAELEAAAPTEQQPNVRALGEFTIATLEDLEAMNTVEELQAWADGIQDDPDAVAVQVPARAITAFVQERCGISLTS